jgi:hypothetical protein
MGVPALTAAQSRGLAEILGMLRTMQETVGEAGPAASDLGFADWGEGLVVVRCPLPSSRGLAIVMHYVIRPDGSSRTVFDKAEKRNGEKLGRAYEKAMKRGFYFKKTEKWSPPA